MGVLPPFVGVAIKVTEVPAQMVVADAVIPTAGVRVAITDIVMVLEFAIVGKAQVAFDVRTTCTTSALLKVDVVYVGEFVPTFIALTFH